MNPARRAFHRRLQRLLVAAVGTMVLTPCAMARSDGLADRPITLVVGFSAGGSNDIAARAIAQPLGQVLGVPVVVENRVGAAGMIGTSFVANAAPDGHTLMVASASPVVVSPHTQLRVPYDAQKAFAAIGLIGVTPEVLAVNPKLPANDLAELVALAKTRDITLASSGNGGLPHLAIELFRSNVPGGKLLHVPYKGAAPAVTDVLAGHVDAVVVDLPAVYNQILDGRLRGIVVADGERSTFLPKLPTSGETGLPNFVAVNWIGLLAPARTPANVIERLHSALKTVLERPDVRKLLEQSAVQIRASETPSAFRSFLEAEYGKWGRVVKESGIKPSAD